VTGIRHIEDGATSRVEADVDGFRVWFESDEARLRPSVEALGSAFLVPTLLLRRRLELEGRADPKWSENLEQLIRTFRAWWKTPLESPSTQGPGLPAATNGSRRGTALCFSAGVDSFHALLGHRESVASIVTVQGYDMPVTDQPRMQALEATLREVSAQFGVRSIVIRTNLREHPLIRATPWERTHGGALAAIGHLLGDEIGRLLIASSIPYRSRREWWGSHWRIDPLWSSSRVTVANVGAEQRRIEKLRTIAGEPIVRRHLRVCWENRDPSGNCSRCGKCLLAMMILADCGALTDFPVFREADRLAERVNALPSLQSMRLTLTDLASSESLPPDLSAAARSLLARTRRARSFPVRAGRQVLGMVRSWTGGRKP